MYLCRVRRFPCTDRCRHQREKIENGLNAIDLKSQDMQGILVTHEHIDHIAGLGVMARRYGLPLYATPGTIDAIKNVKSVGKIDESLFHPITPMEEFSIGDLEITPIPISHDAAEPVAYRIKRIIMFLRLLQILEPMMMP